MLSVFKPLTRKIWTNIVKEFGEILGLKIKTHSLRKGGITSYSSAPNINEFDCKLMARLDLKTLGHYVSITESYIDRLTNDVCAWAVEEYKKNNAKLSKINFFF